MRLPSRSLLPFLVPLWATPNVLADFLGPSYPAPSDISSSSSLVAAGWKNVSSTIQAALASSDAAVALMKNVTFSIGMFSAHDPNATSLQFHYTSPEIANAANGTHSVNADSIYGIASVTKLFTVLAALRELNHTGWETPLTDIFPVLASYAQSHPGASDPIYTVQWDKITPAALAAQIAGVPRDGFPSVNEIALWQVLYPGRGLDPASLGLPVLATSDPLADPPCADTLVNGTCDPVPYLEGVANRAPSFLPWTQPAYANDGFSLFGLAVEALTGRPFAQIYNESVFAPLGMSSSSITAPPPSEWGRCVIPGDPATNFISALEVFLPSGGVYSTTSDLARLGVGILNSTLLPPEETRRWMKPVSHTARLAYSVGRPWEIIRLTVPGTGGKITDAYTKLGDSGAFSAYMVLLPDYGAGFSIQAGSILPERLDVLLQIAQIVADTIVPAFEQQAAAEAAANFAGIYAYAPAGGAAANTSLTLALNSTVGAAPGLVLTSWFSNGTDELAKAAIMTGAGGPFRLVPAVAGPGAAAFRLLNAGDAPGAQEPAAGLFAGPAIALGDWIDVDSPTYGGVGVSLFVFDIGGDGKATAVSPAAYRTKLARTA